MLGRYTLWQRKVLNCVGAVIIALVALSACGGSTGTTTTTNTTPIKIGISVSLSGDFSADGKATEQGYQLWADTINKNGGLLRSPGTIGIPL